LFGTAQGIAIVRDRQIESNITEAQHVARPHSPHPTVGSEKITLTGPAPRGNLGNGQSGLNSPGPQERYHYSGSEQIFHKRDFHSHILHIVNQIIFSIFHQSHHLASSFILHFVSEMLPDFEEATSQHYFKIEFCPRR
jgi:hypothetical protein